MDLGPGFTGGALGTERLGSEAFGTQCSEGTLRNLELLV